MAPENGLTDKKHRRKRLRKTRTKEVSSESSSSSSSEAESAKTESSDSDSSDDSSSDDGNNSDLDLPDALPIESSTPSISQIVKQPNGKIAMNLVPDVETADEAAFLGYYKATVTKDFYDELEALRKTSVTDANSEAEYLRVLNSALASGANIYAEDEKEVILSSLKKE